MVTQNFPLRRHIATPKKMSLQSLFPRGSGKIFVVGRLYVPFGVQKVTTRTMPSFPAWVSVMKPVGHWSGVMLSSPNRSPICR